MPINEPSFDDIKQFFMEWINNIISGEDRYLLEHRVHERTIVWRLSCILNSMQCFNWYDIDCEYNKSWENSKWSDMEWWNWKIKIPDLIIHKRGKYINDLLYCEFKLWNKWMTEKNKIIKRDIDRIKKFIENSPYNYKYWAFVYFSKIQSKSWIIRFKKNWQWKTIAEQKILI